MFPQACDDRTALGTEADGPAQLVLLLEVLLHKPWAVKATICALWNQLCDSALDGPAPRRAV